MRLPWAVARGVVRALTGTARACSSGGVARLERFTDKHEWVRLEKESESARSGAEASVGISEYAQDALGEVVFVQLPEVGARLAAGDECGSLESVKAASELYSPVSGTVTARNDRLHATPSLVNSSPFDEGWLFKLRLADSDQLDKLMDRPQYDDFLKTDHH
ncbi:glycine cleavage system H protein, mitochondrial [Arctopsyche grandis]|uniref:glycine cleavage system H protein, mitochondrial n=1 Tax=Arctopsyche grandis TaxID=121162 RepID=UPI00406DA36D